MDWEAWQRASDLDGSNLWDVYVLGTDRNDWQRLLDWLRGTGLPMPFRGAASSASLPPDVGTIFAERAEGWTHTLCIDPQGVNVNTHFFIEEEVEFDLRPRDVHDAIELARLQAFLVCIAKMLDQTVLVTPENDKEHPWFEIAPNGATRSCFVRQETRQ
jgi:hypothetical protein